ncbi:MAG TPA: urease subunit beta [Candidatus Corynebacterium gallistercoris]|uniref:Urease subunit beta n=1 Tax=Candidatus Corynebacterium gallistercoris TaxID=2838530 RepID=A0A9D1RZJ0_9CORY|nr:urease subunit beta [Candidatus Corynebacterium gallistercoris]
MSGGHTPYITQEGSFELNPGRPTSVITVANTGDRAIQVGSHYHFFEVNPALEFPRAQAWGTHLNIPAGLAIRFEPGDERDVELVDFGGSRTLYGFANLVNGQLDDPEVRERGMDMLDSFLTANNESVTIDSHTAGKE